MPDEPGAEPGSGPGAAPRPTVAVIGHGRIGRRLARLLLADAGLPRLTGILARSGTAPDAEVLAPLVHDLGALLAPCPDIVVECAGTDAFVLHGPAILATGADLIPLSLAALADRAAEARLRAAAEAGPGRLVIPPGAVGSLDLIAAAREAGLRRLVLHARNNPLTWRRGLVPGAPLTIPEEGPFFRGPVRDAAALFPRGLNVAVGVALAGPGLDKTEAELVADPAVRASTSTV